MSQHRNCLCLLYRITSCTVCFLYSFLCVCCRPGNSDIPCMSQRTDGFCSCCSCLFTLFVSKDFSTVFAGPVLIVSGFFTGGCFRFCLSQLVTCGCNHLFFHSCLCCSLVVRKYSFAASAGPVCFVSILCTGCFFCFCLKQLMACGCNHLLFCCCLNGSFCISKYLLTGSTGPVCMISGFFTGGCLLFCLSQLMTCGCNHLFFHSCLCCSLVICKYLFTDLAGPVCFVSIFCTGCFSGFRLFKAMSKSYNLLLFYGSLCRAILICIDFSADLAGPVCFVSILCTGCFFCFCLCQAMTCSWDFFIASFQYFSANAAHLLCIARFRTGWLLDVIHIIVIMFCNLFSVHIWNNCKCIS